MDSTLTPIRPEVVISGGQTGADRAFIDVALELGIPLAGYVPQGYYTEDGPDLFLKEVGLKEGGSYRNRTILNVSIADLVIIFADDETSSGTVLTIRTCKRHKRPYLVNPDLNELHVASKFGFGGRIMGAGNRESVAPGIYSRVKDLMLAAWA